MGDEGRTAAELDPEGTPPDDGTGADPEPDPQGTPPDGGEGRGAGAPDDPAKGTGIESAKTPEPEGHAWENFQKKYPNMPEDDLKEFFAEQWWEKSNYAKEQRERAERESARADRAERELEELRSKGKKDQPKAPHPDVEKIAVKVRALVDKDKALADTQKQHVKDYNDAFTQAQRARGKAELAKESGDEDAAARWENQAISFESRAQSSKTNLEVIRDRREELNERVTELIQEQQFAETWVEEHEREEEEDRREVEERIAAFPVWVDEQTVGLARELGVPEDKHTMTRLHKHVRRAMHYDLAQPDVAKRSLDSLPLDRMLKGHVKEFMDDNDIKERKKFGQVSRDKLKTTTPPPRSPAPRREGDGGQPPEPKRPKKPVPASFLSRGGDSIPEAWKRGREYLKSRGVD